MSSTCVTLCYQVGGLTDSGRNHIYVMYIDKNTKENSAYSSIMSNFSRGISKSGTNN